MSCKVQVKIYDETGKRVFVRDVLVQGGSVETATAVEEYLDSLIQERAAGPVCAQCGSTDGLEACEADDGGTEYICEKCG